MILRLTPRRARIGTEIFTGVVVGSVGLALAGLTWRLQGYTGTSPAAAPVAPGINQGGDIRPVLALAPFGSATALVAGSPGDASIQLRAIFMAVPAEASIVLIAAADGKVASYGLGQAVGDGVIEAIAPEQITLRTGAGTRVIGFTPAEGTPLQPVAAAPGIVGAPPAAAPPAPTSGAAGIRALIPAASQGLAPAAPAAAPMSPAAPPATSNGGTLRIGAAPPPMLAAAGIRPGDVIERVNGTAVNSGTNERDLIARAMAAGSAQVTIVRNGQRLTLSVPVN